MCASCPDRRKAPGAFYYGHMGVWVHRLTNKNIDAKTAECVKCGPVSLRIKAGVWRCAVGFREQKLNRGDHGLTYVAAKRLREGKTCVICGSAEMLRVDHCHATGSIRGVLCHHCSTGLGSFRDNPQLLAEAIRYLDTSRAVTASDITQSDCR